MALRPLQDRLLVKRLEEGEQVQGGIIIPDTAKEKPQQAKVLAVGPGRVTDDGKLQPIEVKVGDTVKIRGERDEEITQIFGGETDDTLVAEASSDSETAGR